jgi:ADP-heptose:LPS heptosyltransferase
MNAAEKKKIVSVRLEGGLGDHILGMRVLHFIQAKRPEHDIVVYSDAGGHPTQAQIAAWSPVVSRVVPVRSTPPARDRVGRLENIHPYDLARMLSADEFIEAWGGDMFTSASVALRVPFFEILAARPILRIPPDGEEYVEQFIERYAGASFVGIHLGKGDPETIARHKPRIEAVLSSLLELRDVILLNMFTSGYDFPHWPEAQRSVRAEASRCEAVLLESFGRLSDRIVSCRDLPLATIAALLKRTKYFVGIDNGIKHLAWALGVPHTFFVSTPFRILATLRWMPDLNRMLRFDCEPEQLEAHLAQARLAVVDGLSECGSAPECS